MEFAKSLVPQDIVLAYSKLSANGLPLVTRTEEFIGIAASKFNADNPLAAILPTVVPAVAILAYLVGERILYSYFKGNGIKGNFIKLFTALHSIALTIYSFVTFVNAFTLVYDSYTRNGWEETFCDPKFELWNAGMGFWFTLFYASKFWEFLDTIIIAAKGYKPSFLQVYHHAGVVLCMWMMVVSQETGGLIVITVLYSFIPFPFPSSNPLEGSPFLRPQIPYSPP